MLKEYRTDLFEQNNSDLIMYTEAKEVQLLRYYEPGPGVFIAESPNVIKRALDAGYEPISFLADKDAWNDELKNICSVISTDKDIPVYIAPHEDISKMTGFPMTKGLLAALRRNKLPSITELLDEIPDARRIVVMEDVMNPTNLGAMYRGAAALNMDAIILTKACTDPLYRRASRVSMGTVFQIPWTIAEEDEIRKNLKDKGYKTVAMALRHDTIDIRDSSLKNEGKLAIYMGSEGPGLKEDTIDSCDYTVKIPMSHEVDSLNVASAAAIAFWELGQ